MKRAWPVFLLIQIVLLTGSARADFDVNAVAGTVTIRGRPAASGSMVNITDLDKGLSLVVPVDGPEVPPFMWGRGRFDTGDVPFLETGDSVIVEVVGWFSASERVKLQAGTTRLELRVDWEEVGQEGSKAQGELPSDIGAGHSSSSLLQWVGGVRAGLGRSFRMIGTMASETLQLLGLLGAVLLLVACAMLGAALLLKRTLVGRAGHAVQQDAGEGHC